MREAYIATKPVKTAANDAKKAPATAPKQLSRFEQLSEAANQYGERSFDNYAQIRSLAERVRDGLCAYLQGNQKCVFLVPPQGAFVSQNYGSGAFSVSGKGFLPLEPISFGLGVRISTSGDFMRIVLHCRKEGDKIYVQIEQDRNFEFDLPLDDKHIDDCMESLFQYLLHWFTDRTDQYDNGHYGSTDIGFDIQRVDITAQPQ